MFRLKDKRIMVTGACGTVGSELVRQLIHEYEPAEVIGIDNNESELFFLEQRLAKFPNTRFTLADIRDAERLKSVMTGIDVVFHAAAFKHVILCERAPHEAVQNNILGVQNLVRAARANRVENVVFTSSDKAVNPTSVMGTSKLMGERLITAANSNYRQEKPKLISTRFGNVLGSRGSVIPIFRNQIARGGPVTITERGMTRFIMSISQAVRLVIDSLELACGGEVFITKMPVIRITDLAQVMIDHLAPLYGHDPGDIKITTIGSKPGEKLYEELMSEEESRRSLEVEKYYIVQPAFTALYRKIEYQYKGVLRQSDIIPYNSANETPLGKEELKSFLVENGLLEETPVFSPEDRYWPDPSDNH